MDINETKYKQCDFGFKEFTPKINYPIEITCKHF